MKKYVFLLIALLVTATTFSQSFNGYRSGNYTGVNGVFFNPANIADSRYRWDVNLFGINAGLPIMPPRSILKPSLNLVMIILLTASY
jgi:hypothetical protein